MEENFISLIWQGWSKPVWKSNCQSVLTIWKSPFCWHLEFRHTDAHIDLYWGSKSFNTVVVLIKIYVKSLWFHHDNWRRRCTDTLICPWPWNASCRYFQRVYTMQHRDRGCTIGTGGGGGVNWFLVVFLVFFPRRPIPLVLTRMVIHHLTIQSAKHKINGIFAWHFSECFTTLSINRLDEWTSKFCNWFYGHCYQSMSSLKGFQKLLKALSHRRNTISVWVFIIVLL